MTLSPSDKSILEFERSWWNEPGTKDEAIGRVLQLTPAEYVEALERVVDNDEALIHDPLVVRRLRRARDRRRSERQSERAAGGDPS